jgi:hypothetical protein
VFSDRILQSSINSLKGNADIKEKFIWSETDFHLYFKDDETMDISSIVVPTDTGTAEGRKYGTWRNCQ